MKNKKICFVIALLFYPILALSQSDGMFWTARLNNGSIQYYRSDSPTINALYYMNSGINTRYLKITNNAVVEMTEQEKYMVDLPEKYKKTVDGVIVEMTEQEKYMIDLPEKYKKIVDGVVVEMTEEEKNSVDASIIATNELLRVQAEINRQNAKNPMLKQIENLYITFLTNDWTTILKSKSIISSNSTINVTNTSYSKNMVYLISLRTIDRDSYIKFASEFKLFEETIKDAFASDLSDAVWHD